MSHYPKVNRNTVWTSYFYSNSIHGNCKVYIYKRGFVDNILSRFCDSYLWKYIIINPDRNTDYYFDNYDYFRLSRLKKEILTKDSKLLKKGYNLYGNNTMVDILKNKN